MFMDIFGIKQNDTTRINARALACLAGYLSLGCLWSSGSPADLTVRKVNILSEELTVWTWIHVRYRGSKTQQPQKPQIQ